MTMSLFLTFVTLLTATCCLGSHFRGGIFTWTPTELKSQIMITYRVSWRRSYSNSHFCNDWVISSGQLLPGEGSIVCSEGCFGTVSDLQYYCTDYSESEDWTTGTKTFLYNLTTTSPIIAFTFASCCWINLAVTSSGDWSLQARASVTPRSDTGKLNSSPRTSVSPVVRIAHGCYATINLLVSDPDGDLVKCRWSNGSKECGGICLKFPGAILKEDTCTITYNASRNVGFHGVAVQVEDFPSTGSTVPYSSVPVQFLVEVYSTNQSCYSLPEFIPPTRSDKEVVYVSANSIYFDKIVAISNVNDKRIVEITTVSPSGFIKSSLAEYPDVSGAWYVNISWTPSTSDANKMHILCFTATDEVGLTSQQRCINLIVPPDIIVNGTENVNECIDPELNTCDQLCNNEIGGFSCSCHSGYVQSNNFTNLCEDVNECLVGQAGCQQICENGDGRYTCNCYFGYVLNNDRKTQGEWLLILVYLGKGYGHDLIHVANSTQDGVSSFTKPSPLSSIGALLEYYYMRDLHIHIAMSVITSFVIFYGIAGGFEWYFYIRQRNKAEEWKCQPDKWLSLKEKRNEVLLGSFNMLIGSTISGCLSCYIMNGGKNSLYTNTYEYGWTYLLFTVFALCMYNEAWAYHLHLLLHNPYFYKTIHKWHHHYGSPTVFSATAMHPAEFISFQICMILPVFTVPLHVGVYIAVILYIYYYGMIAHSGIKMDSLWPWQPPSIFHDDHHRYSNCNYGFNSFIFDKLHGTLRRKDQGCRYKPDDNGKPIDSTD